MYRETNTVMGLFLVLALAATTEAFFLKWGSDSSGQASSQKAWVQPMQGVGVNPFRYQYTYSPYDTRKIYQMQSNQYVQPQMQQSMAPIPISVPAGASLTPVSLQHVQLVPCMCPVAPEEADKLQEQVGPGPYIAQTYSPSYALPEQVNVADNTKNNGKQ